MIRKRIRVSGRVQGVFFRDSCRRVALDAGVRGWVRNLADGSVEAVFEGDAADVDRLVVWAHAGPREARVADVQVNVEEPEHLSGFTVLPTPGR